MAEEKKLAGPEKEGVRYEIIAGYRRCLGKELARS